MNCLSDSLSINWPISQAVGDFFFELGDGVRRLGDLWNLIYLECRRWRRGKFLSCSYHFRTLGVTSLLSGAYTSRWTNNKTAWHSQLIRDFAMTPILKAGRSNSRMNYTRHDCMWRNKLKRLDNSSRSSHPNTLAIITATGS